MGRRPRVQFPGALYHVTARGVDRLPIVRDDVDRERWMAQLASVVERRQIRVYAYCLMDNHYHVLTETPEANLDVAMLLLNSPYASAFNRRHGRIGPLLQGRYDAVLVERQEHLLEVARYVVLNPVRARICSRAEDWRWSSYRATAGLCRCPKLLSVEWLLGQFGERDEDSARSRYAEFVADGAPTASLAGLLVAA
jgi:putative transposase